MPLPKFNLQDRVKVANYRSDYFLKYGTVVDRRKIMNEDAYIYMVDLDNLLGSWRVKLHEPELEIVENVYVN